MRRLVNLWLPLAAAVAVILSASRARADIVLYDKDGWGFYTRGQVAGFYQLMIGDAQPPTAPGRGPEVGGLLNDLSVVSSVPPLNPTENSQVALSRVRSGFVGTQIGFGVRRDINTLVHVDSLMAVSLQDISNGRNVGTPEGVDFREAWANLVTPYGTLRFGRMFSIFGSASAEVVLLAYRYGIGNPCVADTPTIACGSVGAGPIYAGFNSEFRYVSPRLAGFQLQLSMGDPISGQVSSYTVTPVPRFDGEINYDHNFNDKMRLRVIGQGVWQEMQRLNANMMQTANIWGGMGSAIFEAYGFAAGAGGWEGAGIGTTRLLELPNGANDSLSFDNNGELRLFRGYYGNLAYDYHGTRLAVGTGIVYVRSTPYDLNNPTQLDVLDHNAEWHIVFTQQIDTVVLTAEYAHWATRWNSQQGALMNFTSVGANFYW
jgi:hypothetical protein